MNKNVTINACTCEHCGYVDQIRSADNAEREFRVCHHCGKISLVSQFDAKNCLVKLIHEDITDKEALAEQLEYELNERYGDIDFVSTDSLAKLFVRELYDEAMFIAEAEDQEATEFLRERQEAMLGVY